MELQTTEMDRSPQLNLRACSVRAVPPNMEMEGRVVTLLCTLRVLLMESRVETQSTEPLAHLPTLVAQPMAQHMEDKEVTQELATARAEVVSRSILPTRQQAWALTRVHPTHQTPQVTTRA